MYSEVPSSAPIVGPNIDIAPFLTSVFNFIVGLFPKLVNLLGDIFGIIIAISFPISMAFLIGIIISVEKLKEIRKKEAEIYDKKVEPAFSAVAEADPTLVHKWTNVQKYIESPNQSDWKQAILEADAMLDVMLTKMGYRGESVGEKLKRVEPSDFDTLHEAWEAHKVRNQIAHEGGSFSLNQHEAKRVVMMYRKVFEEFYYI